MTRPVEAPTAPVFTAHLHEFVAVLRPTEPLWWGNGGRDLTLVQLNITYRYDPESLTARIPWSFARAVAYGEDGGGFTRQVKWTEASKPERVPWWLPDLIDAHTPRAELET